MQMNETIRIEAPREKVFEALNDPDILRRCIPGCESLEKTSDNEMNATVMAKVGPVKAKFKGDVTLSDVNPPESYTISGQGKGGAAGFAKGSASVTLDAVENATNMTYHVKADVGGKLAQLGSRLIDGVAKRLANEFFEAFKAEVEGPAAEVPAAAEEAEAVPAETTGAGLSGKIWLIVAALVAAALVYYFAR